MNSSTSSMAPVQERPTEAAGELNRKPTGDHPQGLFGRASHTAWCITRFVWTYAVAMVCTQSAALAVLFVGWTQRNTQRAIYRRWWQLSSCKGVHPSFAEFIGDVEEAAHHQNPPNWIVRQDFLGHMRRVGRSRGSGWRVIRALPRASVNSLWLNIKVGLQVLFNTWVFTLPGCVLMAFSWQFGWNNSFFKGYEQAHIGPATGLFGMAVFIAAMMYVPMATARQAATGNWRSFYDFGLVTRLVRRRAFRCVGLAALFALFALPLNVLKTLPGLLTSGGGEFAVQVESMTREQARSFLVTYFFWASAVLVPTFVAVRLVAGRIYASAMLAELQHGKSRPMLCGTERTILQRLDLLEFHRHQRHPIWRAMGFTFGRAGLAAASIAMVAFWFVFVAQTYVSEFLNYHTQFGLAWLNHPLVQLPYFQFIPSGLQP